MSDIRVLKMIDRKGFTDLYLDELGNDQPQKVFMRLNDEYFKATGNYRYSSYDSFRRANLCKDRRIKA